MLNIISISVFDDNYIWLMHQQGNNNCIVVDPGDADPVLDILHQKKLNLESILITHHHPDHTAGISELVAATGATVYGPEKEEIQSVDYSMSENDTIELDKSDLNFTVIDVPGHTRGHIAYYTEDALFSGDSLFAGGCGRLFEGTAEQMHDSLSKLAKLPANTRIFCAHEYTETNLKFALAVEPDNAELINRMQDVIKNRAEGKPTVPSLLALELATNPFLRCHHQSLKQVANSRLNQSASSEVETFASIRNWKDSF